MLKNWKRVRQVIFLNKEQIEHRLNICKVCDKFTEKQFCKECGCYMPAKVTIRRMECPLKKWTKILIDNDIKK